MLVCVCVIRCSVLQCVIVCCSVFQYVVVCVYVCVRERVCVYVFVFSLSVELVWCVLLLSALSRHCV